MLTVKLVGFWLIAVLAGRHAFAVQMSGYTRVSTNLAEELETNDDLFEMAVEQVSIRVNERFAAHVAYLYVPYKVNSLHIGRNNQSALVNLTLVMSQCRNSASGHPIPFKTLKECGGILEDHHYTMIQIMAIVEKIELPATGPTDTNQTTTRHRIDMTLTQPLHGGEAFPAEISDQLRTVGVTLPTRLAFWYRFLEFSDKFKRNHANVKEKLARYQIFKKNYRKIQVLNILRQQTEESVRYGVTEFADLTEAEFRATRLSRTVWDQSQMPSKKAEIPANQAIPAQVDWRTTRGMVSPVKNQGSCGSCWAFSTTGNIEGQWFKRKRQPPGGVSLSEQELVDCDTIDQGCNGGLPSNAYKQIQKLGGLETEQAYPYTGHQADHCKLKKSLLRVYVNGSQTLPTDEKALAGWLAANGPVSIGINAFAMQFYFGGISHPWRIFCNPKSLDHGVLIVGYGSTSSGEPYWIIKNSWGPSWGENGYYRIYRGDGSCGVNKMPTSAIVL